MPLNVFTAFSPSSVGTYTIFADNVGWFDARGITNSHLDILSWNFGDGNELYTNPLNRVDPIKYPQKQVGANDGLHGQVVAHWFKNPSTYRTVLTVFHTDTGRTSQYTVSVVVKPDPRPKLTLDKGGATDANALYSAATKGNVRIQLAAGISLTMPGTCRPGPFVGVFGPKTATLVPAPGSPLFAGIGNGSTTDFMLNGMTVADPTVSGMIAHATGTGWSIVDVDAHKLSRDVWGSGVDGLLVQGLNQLDVVGTVSQGVYVDSGTRVAVSFCNFTGSDGESPIRTTSTGDGAGGAYGMSVECAYVAQPVTNGKAAVTIRAGADYYIGLTVGYGANLSCNVGIGNSTATIGKTRVNGIVWDTCVVDCAGRANVVFLIQDGVLNALYRNWDARVFHANAGLVVDPNWDDATTLTGLQIGSGSVTGANATAVQINGAPPWATPANGVYPVSTGWPGAIQIAAVTVNGHG